MLSLRSARCGLRLALLALVASFSSLTASAESPPSASSTSAGTGSFGAAEPAESIANTASIDAVLPPEITWDGRPWEGASRSLALDPDSASPWLTPAEASAFRETPSYDETVAWLRRLEAAAPEVSLVEIGRSNEGRPVWMVVVSKAGARTPAEVDRDSTAVVLVEAGIHSGEIDGKDAGLMLLRDLTVRSPGTPGPKIGSDPGAATGTSGLQARAELLDRATLLFVPILNVDGHERTSTYGRINQRGPDRTGWRTNARNRNLNRDWAKADTPEVRAILGVLDQWEPDLFVDLHVTDGIDYQYDITWGGAGPAQAQSPASATWLEDVLRPAMARDLEAAGHVPGRLVFAIDGGQPDRGLFDWTASSPRYSDGYGDARHLPTILVENHSLKPYRQRVLGTYVLLESLIDTAGAERANLRSAIQADRARRPDEVTLAWTVDPEAEPERVEFLGVGWHPVESAVTGAERVVWTGEPQTVELPRVAPTEAVTTVRLPTAYWVPAPWADVIERLEAHGLQMETLAAPRRVDLTLLRLEGATIDPSPFEGRVALSFEDGALDRPLERVRRSVTLPAGSVRVPTDQPLGELAAMLLEPTAPDSFFRWGFFLESLQRTEYVEAYVMEPTAVAMLEADPALRRAFEERLEADADFAASPRARLQWFYERSPFIDQAWKLYPVGLETEAGTEPVEPQKPASAPGID